MFCLVNISESLMENGQPLTFTNIPINIAIFSVIVSTHNYIMMTMTMMIAIIDIDGH